MRNNLSLTTPDIILSNGKAYHNTHISQGTPTSSDHIPIVFTISTAPIIIPAPQRLNINKTNREKYQETIESELPEINLEGKKQG